ncbi:Hypothetical predicted protein [Podarcis lilfordi]|uniref:Uncharacterized protein n=1 Tax=Podarcis lilfordi TaxID=74358 RepID=A0AA35NUK7_9SAUR|nr:Hypothetical predicted protein [Podarcis lilfordi]
MEDGTSLFSPALEGRTQTNGLEVTRKEILTEHQEEIFDAHSSIVSQDKWLPTATTVQNDRGQTEMRRSMDHPADGLGAMMDFVSLAVSQQLSPSGLVEEAHKEGPQMMNSESGLVCMQRGGL